MPLSFSVPVMTPGHIAWFCQDRVPHCPRSIRHTDISVGSGCRGRDHSRRPVLRVADSARRLYGLGAGMFEQADEDRLRSALRRWFGAEDTGVSMKALSAHGG